MKIFEDITCDPYTPEKLDNARADLYFYGERVHWADGYRNMGPGIFFIVYGPSLVSPHVLRELSLAFSYPFSSSGVMSFIAGELANCSAKLRGRETPRVYKDVIVPTFTAEFRAIAELSSQANRKVVAAQFLANPYYCGTCAVGVAMFGAFARDADALLRESRALEYGNQRTELGLLTGAALADVVENDLARSVKAQE